MKKRTMQFLSALLAVCLVLSAAPLTGFMLLAPAPVAEAYAAGDYIQYGSYPQSRVTDETLIAQLDAAEKTWTSYGYYTGVGGQTSAPSDFMRFADFLYSGNKYRAVYFSKFRPYETQFFILDADHSYQDENGYAPDQVYYFLYEPITWQVLDSEEGLIVTENILDSQAYLNLLTQEAAASDYPRAYVYSSIRSWLNYDFYETAFSAAQKSNIRNDVTIQNDYWFDAQDNPIATVDRIFLLSATETKNSLYGFSSNAARCAQGTDYAQCQGLFVDSDGTSAGNSPWMLRSCGDYGGGRICAINKNGGVEDRYLDHWTYLGIRAACRLTEIRTDTAEAESLFSETAEMPAVETVCIDGGEHTWCEESTITQFADGTAAGVIEDTYYCHMCGAVKHGNTAPIPPSGLLFYGIWTSNRNNIVSWYSYANGSFIDENAVDAAIDANISGTQFPSDAIRFRLYQDGTMVVYGSGEIPDCSVSDYLWSFRYDVYHPDTGKYSYIKLNPSFVKKLIVAEGITGIGECAFLGCTSLEEVQLPSTLETIGYGAFEYCTALSGISVPQSVRSISNEAFAFCTSLAQVELNEGLEQIGEGAFYFAPIGSLSIPSTCSSIGEQGVDYLFAEETAPRYQLTELSVYNDTLVLPEQLIPHYPAAASLENAVLYAKVIAARDLLRNIDRILDGIKESIGNYSVSTFYELKAWISTYEYILGISLDPALSKASAPFVKLYEYLKPTWEAQLLEFISDTLQTNITLYDVTGWDDDHGVWMSGNFDRAVQNTFGVLAESPAEGTVYASSATIKGHAGAACETYAQSIGAAFVCMHEYGEDHLCIYCGEHSAPVWSAWADNGPETHIRYDTQDPAYTETAPHTWDDGEIIVIPTPDAAGIRRYTCTAEGCGASYDETITSGETVASGTCGDSVTWTLDSCGVLTISGSGAFYGNYQWASLPVKTVWISEGITSIGWAAFQNCTQLTSVSIPETVTCIEESAFGGCSSLASIALPQSLTRLDGFAFYGTAWYENQPDGMVYIGDIAYGYKGEMPENTEIVLREGTRVVAGNAFRDYTQLTSVTIPAGAVSIGSWAFYGCTGLTAVSIPDSVREIRYNAFYGCAALTSVHLPVGLTAIECRTFCMCRRLASVTIPDGVTCIEEDAFFGCDSLNSVSIPDSVTSIGTWAFSSCTSVTSLSIGKGVSEIGEHAFGAFFSLRSITVDAQNPYYHAAGNCLIETAEKKLILGCNESVIPADGSVETICAEAFSEYASLESIAIPASVTAIEPYAFYGCVGLQSITVAEGNPKYHAVGNCLIDTAQKKLLLGCNESVIPADGSVERIGEYAFFGCAGLESVHIPACVIEIEDLAFAVCPGLQSITVAEGNPNYHAEGNCLIDTAQKKLLLGCNESVIPADGSVTSIGMYAFYRCLGLSSLTIPGSVLRIEEDAFGECAGLESVVISEGTVSIGPYVFDWCTGLSSISIPASVTQIDEGAVPEYTVIYGNTGSYAQTWAQNNGRAFLDPGETFVDMYAPSAVADPVVDVWGYTNPGAAVVCSVNGAAVQTVTAAASGKWSASLPLTGAQDGDRFGIAAEVALNGHTVSESAEVTYLPEAVVFDSLTLAHSCYSVTVNSEDLGRRTRNITFVPGLPLSVKVCVSNNDRISSLWIESAKADGIKKMALQYSVQDDAWYACGFFENASADYVPGVITVKGEDKYGAAFDTGVEIKINFLIDPSGYAYEAVQSNVLEGVTAAVYYRDAEGHEILWNADPAEQVNPITTLADGAFAWIVPEGTWQVRLNKEGYETAVSEWMDVPPEYSNLYIPMVTTAAPEVSACSICEDYADILFSSYMDIASVTAQTVVFNGYSGTVAPTDAEETYPGSNVFYAKSFRFYPDTVFTGEVSAVISGAANYAGIRMKEIFTQTVSFAQAPSDLVADEAISVECGKTAQVAISAQNAAGGTVTVSSDSAIIGLDSDTVVLDDTGSAVISVHALLPGTATLTFSLEGTALKAYTVVNAELPAAHTEHIWNAGEITTEATCSQSGVRLYICTIAGCNATYEEKINPDPDHHKNTEEVAETASTCYQAGYTAGVYCNDCKQFISGHQVKPQPAHAWDEGTVTLKPTCKTTGTMLYRCTVKSCGATKEETLKADPNAHSYQLTVTEPTCTAAGYTTHTCTLCGYAYTDNATPAKDHIDKNGDGYCDYGCGTYMGTSDPGSGETQSNCVCGKYHTGPFAGIVIFFHRITYFFKNLFNR